MVYSEHQGYPITAMDYSQKLKKLIIAMRDSKQRTHARSDSNISTTQAIGFSIVARNWSTSRKFLWEFLCAKQSPRTSSSSTKMKVKNYRYSLASFLGIKGTGCIICLDCFFLLMVPYLQRQNSIWHAEDSITWMGISPFSTFRMGLCKEVWVAQMALKCFSFFEKCLSKPRILGASTRSAGSQTPARCSFQELKKASWLSGTETAKSQSSKPKECSESSEMWRRIPSMITSSLLPTMMAPSQ